MCVITPVNRCGKQQIKRGQAIDRRELESSTNGDVTMYILPRYRELYVPVMTCLFISVYVPPEVLKLTKDFTQSHPDM